jgi:hypothetical protein
MKNGEGEEEDQNSKDGYRIRKMVLLKRYGNCMGGGGGPGWSSWGS